MLKKDKPIDFTVGDQERLVTIEVVLNSIDRKIDKLPCQLEPPKCLANDRIKSLEESRKKWHDSLTYISLALFIGLVTWLAHKFADLGGLYTLFF